jgi:murein DD-endopeptidase MepM/ murein hydrolase activator NlpD
VARPFAAPRSRYGAGHRGVDLAAHPGQPVLAVDAGTVTHVGVIAGRGTVSVLHTSGLRSTYEPVTATVHRGDVLARGDPVGTVADVAGHCPPQTCLHLGAVRGHTYVDPLQLLGTRRVRLLPLE